MMNVAKLAAAKRLLAPVKARVSKAHVLLRRAELTGAYPDHAAAMAAVPAWALAGYNHDEVVPGALEHMRQMLDYDYPIAYWLEREINSFPGEIINLLDAGGHVGTKYIALRERLNLSRVHWEVYDLPPMVAAGRKLAEREGFGPGLSFADTIEGARPADVLLCSGLLQYLDIPFPEFVHRLRKRPEVVLLNKVALRDGDTLVSLQRAGPAYLPYQIRNRATFLGEIEQLGYKIVDSWRISSLSHQIASHPELGWSESRGFMLRRRAAPSPSSESGSQSGN
jgi:putative methyltransferase (TIGR04325 family)